MGGKSPALTRGRVGLLETGNVRSVIEGGNVPEDPFVPSVLARLVGIVRDRVHVMENDPGVRDRGFMGASCSVDNFRRHRVRIRDA